MKKITPSVKHEIQEFVTQYFNIVLQEVLFSGRYNFKNLIWSKKITKFHQKIFVYTNIRKIIVIRFSKHYH